MLDRLTVRTRLVGTACLLVLVMTVVALVARATVVGLVETTDRFNGVSLPALEELATMDRAVALVIADVRGLSVPWLTDRREAVAARLREDTAEVRAAAERFGALSIPAEQRAAWTELEPKLAAWVNAVEAVAPLLVAAASGAEQQGALALMKRTAAVARMQHAHEALVEGLRALSAANVKSVNADAAATRARSGRAVTTLFVLIAVGGAIAVAILLLVSRGIARSLAALVTEAARVSGAVRAGRLDVRGDSSSTTPEFRPIVDGINETAEAFARPVRMAAGCIDRLSRGDVPPPIAERYEGEFEAMRESLNRAIDAVKALLADAGRLAQAGVEGRLSTRADAARHEGDFRRVIEGVNATLDAFARPMLLAARCIDELSKGRLPPPITAEQQGDFALLRDNLNQCFDAIGRLVTDAEQLAEAGVAGRLEFRADPGRHQGDFRKIVEGVNRSFDAVVAPLQAAVRNLDAISRGDVPARISDEYRGDYAAIKTSVNGCVDAINRLVTDAGALVEAAVAGRLETRADASRHQGDFRKVVDGVNRTLDAVVAPVGEALRVLEALARRDLRARVEGSFQGDHARIQAAVNATGEALETAMAQVAAAVEQVSSAAAQIAASSQAVASGASEQAAALQETGSSLEAVSSMVKQAAEHAGGAKALAATANAAAGEGGAAVEQLQGAMTQIRASAEGTSQIIKDIDDIAFQTNLLALNAAVEAARAGDAGRGFAVVAEEVRSLALRAKDAATRTERLIQQSVRQAGEGELVARRVSGRLGEIVSGIAKVAGIVTEIAAAAQRQTGGIDQVSRAVAEMDKVTQQNAASAEESSSAAAELSGQADALAALVGSFQIDRGGAATSAGMPARRRPAPAPAPAELEAAAAP